VRVCVNGFIKFAKDVEIVANFFNDARSTSSTAETNIPCFVGEPKKSSIAVLGMARHTNCGTRGILELLATKNIVRREQHIIFKAFDRRTLSSIKDLDAVITVRG